MRNSIQEVYYMGKIKRPAVFFIAAILAVCLVFPAVSETKEEVQQKIESLEGQQSELENELAALKKNKSDTETYIAQLDEKIESCLEDMQKVSEQIKETDDKIAKTQEKLAKARHDEQVQYLALKARIKAMYEAGDDTYISLLFGDGNLRSLLNDQEYISKVNEYDKNLLVSLEKVGDKIEVYEADLESQRDVLETQKEAYEVEKDSMELVLSQRKEELAAIGSDIGSLNYDISGIQAKIDAENQAMADILEAERKAAEEAARAEEEKAREAAQKEAEKQAEKQQEEQEAKEEAEARAEAEKEAAEEAAEEAERKAAEEEARKAAEEAERKEAEEEARKEAEEQASGYSGAVLTRSAGVVYGPSGKETYYNMDMSGVISIMRGMGFDADSYPYWVRDDGCKMLGDYIICAANLDVHPRGTTVMSSLGLCLVCDTGGFAYSNPNQLDIATNW